MPAEATKDRLKTVLDYEAQLNRREFLELSAKPADPAVLGLQAEADRTGQSFGVLHPELVADKLIAAVKIELRNRRKLAEMVPELASPLLETDFVAGIESRISAAADLIRKQIERQHYFSRTECHHAPDLVAAHQALVDAQRRGEQVDYGRLFPHREPPDYSPVQRFRFRAAAAVLGARTEFGLMRLRASLGAPDPGERAAFNHAAATLLAAIHDISAAAESLRQQGADAAALAVQAFAAALVSARDIPAPARVELARLAQALVRAALAPRGARDLPAVARLFADINTAATGQPEVAEVWRHCSPEVVRYFTAQS